MSAILKREINTGTDIVPVGSIVRLETAQYLRDNFGMCRVVWRGKRFLVLMVNLEAIT